MAAKMTRPANEKQKELHQEATGLTVHGTLCGCQSQHSIKDIKEIFLTVKIIVMNVGYYLLSSGTAKYKIELLPLAF